MLAITRRPGESVTIELLDGTVIEIMVTRVKMDKATLAIDAPRSIHIYKTEQIAARKSHEGTRKSPKP